MWHVVFICDHNVYATHVLHLYLYTYIGYLYYTCSSTHVIHMYYTPILHVHNMCITGVLNIYYMYMNNVYNPLKHHTSITIFMFVFHLYLNWSQMELKVIWMSFKVTQDHLKVTHMLRKVALWQVMVIHNLKFLSW